MAMRKKAATRSRIATSAAKKVAAKRIAHNAAKKAAARTAASAGSAAKKRVRNPAKSASPKRRSSEVSRRSGASSSSSTTSATKRAAAKRARSTRTRVATKTAAGRPKVESRPRAQREAASVDRIERARRTAEPAAVDPSLFPVGDDALRAATGKTWSEWLALLDAAGAATQAFDHRRIWKLAMQSLPDAAAWWGQMVSVGYERVRGLREKHESGNGEFQGTVSRTFPVPLFAAFAAWADDALRARWLDAAGLKFTKLNAGKNIRAHWPDGSRLDIRFNATGPDKCQVVVDTMKLADGDAVQRAKAFWSAQFERLNALLAG